MQVEGGRYGESSFKSGSSIAILDTGTSLISMPAGEYSDLMNTLLDDVVTRPIYIYSAMYFFEGNCESEYENLRNISFSFNGDLYFTLPP